MKKPPRFTFVSSDASWDPVTGYAAIAACAPGRPLAGQIVKAKNSNEAESRAILMAITAATAAQMRVVEFRSDAEGAVSRIHNGRVDDPLSQKIRERLAEPPRNGLYQLGCVNRSAVQPAHLLAALLWKAFVSGREAPVRALEAVA